MGGLFSDRYTEIFKRKDGVVTERRDHYTGA